MNAKTREEWLAERQDGIGASEAAAILGQSPYLTNERLWEIKTGRYVPDDISDKPYVKYGIEAETHLRALYALDHPQYEVRYEEFKIIRNPEYPFIFATLDGELQENEQRGVLEIKTTEILSPGQWSKWNDCVPDNYYCQILHQLLATGYDFAALTAQIKWYKDGTLNKTIREYHFERSIVQDDINYLLQKEISFWNSVKSDSRPNMILPQI